MGDDEGQGRRGHALDARRLPQSGGPHERQTRPKLVGQAAHGAIVEFGGDQGVLFPTERGDISLLAIQINGIFGVDFDLFGDRGGYGLKLGPNGGKCVPSDVRIGQQVKA